MKNPLPRSFPPARGHPDKAREKSFSATLILGELFLLPFRSAFPPRYLFSDSVESLSLCEAEEGGKGKSSARRTKNDVEGFDARMPSDDNETFGTEPERHVTFPAKELFRWKM